MSYFTKPDAVSSTHPPLSRARIAEYATSKGWSFATDEDGDVGIVFGEYGFFFFLSGGSEEILHVRGRWHRTLPLTELTSTVMLANDFNANTIWPKVFCGIVDDQVAVFTEVATDLEFGVSDDQLGALIDCGLYSGLQFFEKFDAHLAQVEGPASTTDVSAEDEAL